MLIVTDPDADPQLDLQALKALFGFTPAEARLVNLLVSGRSLPDVAKELGIGFETARTHLARARAKTETTSQIDLVRTVLLAVSPLRSPTS
jgi:DNA-binding CsgD family transcriptional regulator